MTTLRGLMSSSLNTGRKWGEALQNNFTLRNYNLSVWRVVGLFCMWRLGNGLGYRSPLSIDRCKQRCPRHGYNFSLISRSATLRIVAQIMLLCLRSRYENVAFC